MEKHYLLLTSEVKSQIDGISLVVWQTETIVDEKESAGAITVMIRHLLSLLQRCAGNKLHPQVASYGLKIESGIISFINLYFTYH
jgi:hypothetical protein